MTYTPDSLRALDKDLCAILEGDHSGAQIGYLRRSIAAHADAWEAERRVSEDAISEWKEMEPDLRKRLAEAQADNAALREKEKTKDEGWFNSIIEVGALRKDNAALREAKISEMEDMSQDDWYREKP